MSIPSSDPDDLGPTLSIFLLDFLRHLPFADRQPRSTPLLSFSLDPSSSLFFARGTDADRRRPFFPFSRQQVAGFSFFFPRQQQLPFGVSSHQHFGLLPGSEQRPSSSATNGQRTTKHSSFSGELVEIILLFLQRTFFTDSSREKGEYLPASFPIQSRAIKHNQLLQLPPSLETMKLDVDALRYLSKEDFRVLTAVEMGMRNHEIVPAELIDRIARLKRGGTYKVLKTLMKHKLLHHDSSKYDGYRLTYLGYDFLAINALVNRGVFSSVGRQIGVGKESDIFEVATEDGTIMAMKLHRLGRISFRAVKSKRDYLLHRRSYNWLYLSRLAALKEYAFMKALGEHEFPVPNAVDCNRHCVVMSLVQGYPLVQVKQLQNPDKIFETIVDLVIRLAEHGLIHCDFNEFNLMIDDDETVTMIDFPQMVSVSHRNAQMYFDRDIECIFKFFNKRFHIHFQEDKDGYDDLSSDVEDDGRPSFLSIEKSAGFLDRELAASGFTRKDQNEIEKFVGGDEQDNASSDDDSASEAQPENGTIAVAHTLQFLDVADQDTRLSDNEIDRHADPAYKPHAVDIDVNVALPEKKREDGSDNSDDSEDGDPVLTRRLNKQRQRAMAAARGVRRAAASRNSYKDKGGKSSRNSKIQMQSSKW